MCEKDEERERRGGLDIEKKNIPPRGPGKKYYCYLGSVQSRLSVPSLAQLLLIYYLAFDFFHVKLMIYPFSFFLVIVILNCLFYFTHISVSTIISFWKRGNKRRKREV